MSVREDAIGNVIGRLEGNVAQAPCLMLGSHLDSVRNAGKYDGPLGVLTAIECVAALRHRPALPFAIEVIGFADEEGVRFQATLLGSRAVAGTFEPGVLPMTDRAGVNMAQALRAFGLDPSQIAQAARRPDEVLAYVELHIEQGPVLEAEGLPVGVVSAINGQTRLRVDLAGRAGHAGTVPMPMRRDALAAAAECVLAVERLCAAQPNVVGTVGQIEVKPGAANVIPGSATFSVDVRAAVDAQRRATVDAVHAAMRQLCDQRGVACTITPIHENPSVACDRDLITQLGGAIAAEGMRVRELGSGAGHDAMALAALCPVAMLFVRCKEGISHHPAEAISADDAAIGARVLLRFMEDFRRAKRIP
jgi:allantoate deiminase